MTEETDPLEGFHITDYDDAKEIVTIQIDKRILSDPSQHKALVEKMIESIKYKTGVSAVTAEPRSK